MQNEIPAGTKVKVAMTQKGVTTVHDAEVLAHMDGLVHVDMDGQAVSVDPSQIVTDDKPVDENQSAAAPPVNDGNAQIAAELIAGLTARIVKLEARMADAESAITEIGDKPVPAVETPAPADPPPPADPAPAPQEQPSEESTAAAETGEAATGS